MLKKLKFPQHHIKAQIEFYDKDQKEKLLAYPTQEQIKEVVNKGINIPIEEFLTYYLF